VNQLITRFFICGTLLLVLILASACSVLGGQNEISTGVAQMTPVEAESTALIATMEAQGTQVAQTAVAAETYIVQMEGINQQLLLTMRAVIPPTQQIVQTSGEVIEGMNEPIGVPSVGTPDGSSSMSLGGSAVIGGTQFVQISTARGVSEVDGCALDTTTTFMSNESFIYITARAYNISAGAVMSAAWSYNGAVVYALDSFTVEQNDDDFCLWFYIDPASVPFSVGQWSVQLLMNGTPVGQPVNFVIEEAM